MNGRPLLRFATLVIFVALTGLPSSGQTGSWFGAAVEKIPPQVAEALGGSQGVLIRRVTDGGPAAQAGLQPGDVILSFNGIPVHGPEHFCGLVAATAPGASVRLSYYADSRRMDTTVTLASKSQPTQSYARSGSTGPATQQMTQSSEALGKMRPAASATGVNIKPMYLSLVSSYIKASKGDSLSSTFFSTGDAGQVIGVVDSYLLGVAVDPAYLSNFKWKQYVGWAPSQEGGLCQPKGQWWTATVTPQQMRYNGWVILSQGPGQDPVTAYHEAIHAYHLAIGSDVDQDAYNGPEYISNNYQNIVMNLRNKVDPEVERIRKKIVQGEDCKADVKKLWKRIRMYRDQTKDWTPQFFACLKNLGGRMDWDGYVKAVEERIGTTATKWVKGALLAGPVSLPALQKEPTSLGIVLEKGKPYIVVGEGECSLWSGQSDGVDSVYRYRTPLEKNGGKLNVWGQLRLVDPNGHLFEFMQKQTGEEPEYNPAHTYEGVVFGEGKTLKAVVHDGGGYSDNSGALRVKVYEAVPVHED